MKRGCSWCVCVATAILCTSAARAAVVKKEVGELTVEASQLLIGDVVSVASFWDENHALINSRIVVAVDQYLVGQGPGTEELVLNGGTVDDVTLQVSVFPVFEQGDHVLLFLKDGEARLVGCFQGAFLTDGELVAQMTPPCNRIIPESVRPLADLLDEVQQALPPGTKLPGITPYQGDFELPLGGSRYGLCGRDWTYMPNPMGEDYYINPNCADGAAGDANSQITQIQNGMGTWDGAGADFRFTYGGTSTQTAVSGNGTNLIYFDTTPPGGGGYVAANYSWSSGGNMTESDIVFNDASYTWWNGSGLCAGMDIWNVGAHELGHTLCLIDLYGGGDAQKTMYGYVSNCETKKRTLHSDDIDGIIAIYGTAYDPDPPTPDPMTWNTPPVPISTHLYMIASEATDALHPPVEYYIQLVSGGAGGDDSGWFEPATPSIPVYEDFGLDPNTEYVYRVKARDSAVPANETAYSASEGAYTVAATPGAPVLSNESSSSMDINVDAGGNPSYTNLAVQCTSTTDGSWQNQYVDASGNASASAVWQTEVLWDGLTISGMQADTQYCFKVKARNEDLVETSLGAQGCGQTAIGGATIISAASLIDHGGTELGLDLMANNIEPRSGGVVKLEFGVSDPVVSVSASVSCVNSTYSGIITTTPSGTTVTVEFDPALDDQDCCEVTLSGDAADSFFVRTLKGDTDFNGVVATTDAGIIKPHFGEAADATNAQYDNDTNGTVATTDFGLIKPLFGNAAPACP